MSPKLVLLSLLSTYASSGGFISALAQTTTSSSQPNTTLVWGPCTDYAAPLECSKFQVPLDYARPSVGAINPAVIRLPAKTSPREGYMFFNPGGPGASGVSFMGRSGARLHTLFGEGWDIVSWDPRGVGDSEPDVSPFSTYAEYHAFWEQLLGTGKVDSRGNLTRPDDIAFFHSQTSAITDFIQQYDAKNRENSGDNLKYIGTCAVVRDLVGMVDAIYGRGADVNFYGVSYGTLIGAYLTQMFPRRVGKVIVDGVLDAVTWAKTSITAGLSTDVLNGEAALRAWSCACAGSTNCTIGAIGNRTTEGVMEVVDGILNQAYLDYDGTKLTFADLLRNGTLPVYSHAWSFYFLTSFLANLVNGVPSWRVLDRSLAGIYAMQHNGTATLNARAELSNLDPVLKPRFAPWNIPNPWAGWADESTSFNQAGLPIACGDSQRPPPGYTTSKLFNEIIQVSKTVSPHFGTLLTPRWACHEWRARAVERIGDIRGIPDDLSIKPKNVVLVIGNNVDQSRRGLARRL